MGTGFYPSFWALEEVSFEFGSIRLAVRPQTKISKLAHQLFLFFFYMKLDSHKVRKVTKLNFWKTVPSCQDDPKIYPINMYFFT